MKMEGKEDDDVTSDIARVRLVKWRGLTDSRSLRAPPINLPTVLQMPPTETKKAAFEELTP